MYFIEEILKIIPKLSLLLLLIWSPDCTSKEIFSSSALLFTNVKLCTLFDYISCQDNAI